MGARTHGLQNKVRPRTAIKLQALADFVAEWMEVQTPTPDITHEYWTLYFDGQSWDLARGPA
jgi:hypothetical protein